MDKDRIITVVATVAIAIFLVLIGFMLKKRKPIRGTLIFYGKPACIWCQRFKPVWDQLSLIAPDEGLHMIHIDCEANPHVAKRDGVSRYPTIKFVNATGVITDYEGERTVTKIIEFTRIASN